MEVDSNVPEANMSDIYSDCNNPLTVTMKEYTNNGETNLVQEPILLNYETATIVLGMNYTNLNNVQIKYLVNFVLIFNLIVSIIFNNFLPYNIYVVGFITLFSFLAVKKPIFLRPVFFVLFLIYIFKIVLITYFLIILFSSNIEFIEEPYIFTFMAFINIFLESILIKLLGMLISNSDSERFGSSV